MSDYLDKVDRLKSLVLSMPPPNQDTMRFMFSHLKRYETPHLQGLNPLSQYPVYPQKPSVSIPSVPSKT
ncbi:unnamed protein product [Oncorhynchus mykiss]|uniref:Uncharacterized protein n=1 Tax=Oncorhynchus mykiss TaxID=8022 RepID=A0A060Z5P0_ONCMY|nr:unnamed protein product [Oncorhynchus mykiss]